MSNTRNPPGSCLAQRRSPVDKDLPRGRLAPGAEEDIVSPDSLSPDGRTASGAWFSLSIPDLHVVAHLDMDGLTRLLDVTDPPVHYGEDGVVKSLQLPVGESAKKGLGMDPGIKEDLVGVGIPDRAENRLVVDENADLLPPVARGEIAKALPGEGG